MCMRTNIVLDEDLLREARKFSRARTKRGLVEEALKTFIQTKGLEARSTGYRERIQKLEGRLSRISLRESPLKVLREARERS